MLNVNVLFQLQDEASKPADKIKSKWAGVEDQAKKVEDAFTKASEKMKKGAKDAREAIEKGVKPKKGKNAKDPQSYWEGLAGSLSEIDDQLGTSFGRISEHLVGVGAKWAALAFAAQAGMRMVEVLHHIRLSAYLTEQQMEGVRVAATEMMVLGAGFDETSRIMGRAVENQIKSRKELGAFTQAIFKMTKVSDLSEDVAENFALQAVNIHRLDPSRLEAIGSAMLSVRDITKASTNGLAELIMQSQTFIERVPQSMKEKTLLNMAAIGGAYEDTGLKASDLADILTRLTDLTDESGVGLRNLAAQGGLGLDGIRESLKKGDVDKLFSAIVRGSKKVASSGLMDLPGALQEVTGLNEQTIRLLARADTAKLEQLVKLTREEAAAGSLLNEKFEQWWRRSWDGIWSRIKNAVQGFVGGSMSPAGEWFLSLADRGLSMFQAIGEWFVNNPVGKQIAKWGAFIASAVVGMKLFKGSLGLAATILKPISFLLGKIGLGLIPKILGGFLRIFTGPIGWIILGIDLLVQNTVGWDKVLEWVSETWGKLKKGIQSADRYLENNFTWYKKIKDEVKEIWGWWDGIVERIEAADRAEKLRRGVENVGRKREARRADLAKLNQIGALGGGIRQHDIDQIMPSLQPGGNTKLPGALTERPSYLQLLNEADRRRESGGASQPGKSSGSPDVVASIQKLEATMARLLSAIPASLGGGYSPSRRDPVEDFDR